MSVFTRFKLSGYYLSGLFSADEHRTLNTMQCSAFHLPQSHVPTFNDVINLVSISHVGVRLESHETLSGLSCTYILTGKGMSWRSTHLCFVPHSSCWWWQLASNKAPLHIDEVSDIILVSCPRMLTGFFPLNSCSMKFFVPSVLACQNLTPCWRVAAG